MRSLERQRGAVLATSLMMLVVVTLLALSSIQSGTVNLRIADNMRATQQARAVTQEAANRILSDIAEFNNPAEKTLTVADADGNDQTVTITLRECVATQTAGGYSANWALAPEDNTWKFTASVETAGDGAKARIEQGVKIRMATGGCP